MTEAECQKVLGPSMIVRYASTALLQRERTERNQIAKSVAEA